MQEISGSIVSRLEREVTELERQRAKAISDVNPPDYQKLAVLLQQRRQELNIARGQLFKRGLTAIAS